MNVYARLGIVTALLAVIAITLAMKQKADSAPRISTVASGQGSGSAHATTADPPGSADKVTAVDAPRALSPEDQTQAEAPASQPEGSKATELLQKMLSPLPRLVDLGAGKCIPCKQMAPILENLKREYAGRMVVEFIDVWENPDAGERYGIRMIPTQIFYDASGKELFRHEGFYSREDILGKWKELGVDVQSQAGANARTAD